MAIPITVLPATPAIAPDLLASIAQWLMEIISLEDLARLGPGGPQTVALIAMDEFTHDVVVRFSDSVYLAFDST